MVSSGVGVWTSDPSIVVSDEATYLHVEGPSAPPGERGGACNRGIRRDAGFALNGGARRHSRAGTDQLLARSKWLERKQSTLGVICFLMR